MDGNQISFQAVWIKRNFLKEGISPQVERNLNMPRFQMYDDGYDVGIVDSHFVKTETNSEGDCFILGPFSGVGDRSIRLAIQVVLDKLNG